MAKAAQALGQPLMPFQRYIADVTGEMLADGTPAYSEIIITVPRQNGKTTIVLVITVERCILRGKPQRVAYTAQTGKDAEEKMLEDFHPLLAASPVLSLAMLKPHRAQGKVSIPWVNGSLIKVVASTEEAGHGKTWDLGLIDEAFNDEDWRREQSLGPGMITKPESQLLILSTMGTDKSSYWNAKVEAGRAAVAAGLTEGTAYFEWSADLSDDPDDPAVWAAANPALGYTITEKALAQRRRTMPDGEFRRAHLNIPTSSDDQVIPSPAWASVQQLSNRLSGNQVFAVEVAPDRSHASIGASDGKVVELIDARPGVGWLDERVAELVKVHGGTVVADGRGPAASLLHRIPFVDLAGDVEKACGEFYDAVAEQRIEVWADPRLDLAVRAALKTVSGDRWRFSRKTEKADVTPLMSVVLAWWQTKNSVVDLRIW